jgi:hypothetical protein
VHCENEVDTLVVSPERRERKQWKKQTNKGKKDVKKKAKT